MNDVRDFWKVILLALVLNVLWDACLYYETPPSQPWNHEVF